MTDVRLIGRGLRAAETIESLSQDQRRWILCSHDYARRAEILSATAEGDLDFAQAYPAESCVDGNRLSYAESASAYAEYVELVLDLTGSGRKALLWLEYFEDDEIEPVGLWLSNSVDETLWNSVYSGMSAVYRDRRHSLWKLPFDTSSSSSLKTSSDPVTGTVIDITGGGSEADDFWIGGYAIPQTGPNAGVPRRILSWEQSTGLTSVEAPWLYEMAAGMQFQYVKYATNYLGSRYLKVRLANRYNAGKEKIRLIGLSIFDYVMVLKGDQGKFQRYLPSNPGAITRKGDSQVRHVLLNGAIATEEPMGGPRRSWSITWPVVYAGFLDFMESWKARGNIGIVDELGRYSQGVLGPLQEDRLPEAVNRGPESSFTTEFIET